MSAEISIFWFRRDLRLHDNAGLYHALKAGRPVLPVFIFDTNILEDLSDTHDKRVQFIHDVLAGLQGQLERKGSTLQVLHGAPEECFGKLLKEHSVKAVYANNDYEPYATKRDKAIAALLASQGVELHSYKDQVIFEKNDIVKGNGTPYTVFTPYSKKWVQKLGESELQPYSVARHHKYFLQQPPKPIPSLELLGFKGTEYFAVAPKLNEAIALNYDKTRDIPAIRGTTRLSVHLRFGTVSIRELVADAQKLNQTLLKELVWREFYQMILWHYPHVVTESFKKEYDKINWRNSQDEFEKWCAGQTGYPIVDAGMRELNETGFMHNRVRMITASFLTKHLLIDWRWGEAYFGEKLLDYDLAANNGGWQWAAGSGCDAAPYFRIFNPQLQTEKFDPQRKYILHWVPEFETADYPKPIVDHKTARERCLQEYKRALNG